MGILQSMPDKVTSEQIQKQTKTSTLTGHTRQFKHTIETEIMFTRKTCYTSECI